MEISRGTDTLLQEAFPKEQLLHFLVLPPFLKRVHFLCYTQEFRSPPPRQCVQTNWNFVSLPSKVGILRANPTKKSQFVTASVSFPSVYLFCLH